MNNLIDIFRSEKQMSEFGILQKLEKVLPRIVVSYTHRW